MEEALKGAFLEADDEIVDTAGGRTLRMLCTLCRLSMLGAHHAGALEPHSRAVLGACARIMGRRAGEGQGGRGERASAGLWWRHPP